MASKWTTVCRGVRFREDPKRVLRNGRPDRYYTLRYRANGQQHEEALGWASEGWTVEKARRVLSTIEQARLTGEGSDSVRGLKAKTAHVETEDGGITLAQFFDQFYLPDAKARKRTWKHDLGRFDKGIRELIGDIPLRLLTKEHMVRLMEGLRAQGLEESTVLHYFAVMRQVFTLAHRTEINGVLVWEKDTTPLTGVRLPRSSRERDRFLSYAEADKLLECAATLRGASDAQRSALCDFISIALYTGLRFGEIMRLRWADVSLEHLYVSVPIEAQRKTGGKVPINRQAAAVLQARYVGDGGQALVFPEHIMGKNGDVMRRLYRDAVDATGLNVGVKDPMQRVVFHTLRHTFASWLAKAGVDINRVRVLMRHKVMAMSLRYAHLLPNDLRTAVDHIRPPRK